MKKKKGNLSEHMQYAGKYKVFTYSSWVLPLIVGLFVVRKNKKNKYDRSLKICGIIVKTSLKAYTSTLQK